MDAGSFDQMPVVHFACHGVQDMKEPLDSGFVLWKGNRLTVSNLMQTEKLDDDANRRRVAHIAHVFMQAKANGKPMSVQLTQELDQTISQCEGNWLSLQWKYPFSLVGAPDAPLPPDPQFGPAKKAHISLAFLSACGTAQGDVDMPDEAMHLAATLMFAGTRSVVATLW